MPRKIALLLVGIAKSSIVVHFGIDAHTQEGLFFALVVGEKQGVAGAHFYGVGFGGYALHGIGIHAGFELIHRKSQGNQAFSEGKFGVQSHRLVQTAFGGDGVAAAVFLFGGIGTHAEGESYRLRPCLTASQKEQGTEREGDEFFVLHVVLFYCLMSLMKAAACSRFSW